MKKTISIALALMLLAAVFPTAAFAERSQDVQVKYTVTQDDVSTPTPTATAKPSPTSTAKPTNPKTGDESNIPLLVTLCSVSALGGVCVYVYIRKKRDGDLYDD